MDQYLMLVLVAVGNDIQDIGAPWVIADIKH